MPSHPLLFALALALCGCATAPTTLPVPRPAEIPELEERLAGAPDDVDAGLLLAVGYREAGRLAEARDLITSLREAAPEDPGLTLMAGFLADDAGAYAEAVDHYRAFLAFEPDADARGEVERRLEVSRVEALRADVRRSLERERDVAQQAPDRFTVGVFPFVYQGDRAEGEPLALALSELLTTDLGVTGRLEVVERIAVQALLDEMALGESGRVEAATAARSGRILGSGHIVQGRLMMDPDRSVQVDASLVEVAAPGAEVVDPLSDSETMERFFDLEKRLALDLYAELGVQLTPAERELVNERQTESIEALLAFGRGLAAADRGQLGVALEHFDEAASLDPSFALARSRRVEAASLAGAVAIPETVARLAQMARRLGLRRDAIRRLTGSPSSVWQRVLDSLSRQQRAVLAEVLGQDRVGQAAMLELFFQAPGGGE